MGQRYGLPLLSPVDDAGRFTAEAGEDLAGLAVLDEGNAAVIKKLQAVNALLKARSVQSGNEHNDRKCSTVNLFRRGGS